MKKWLIASMACLVLVGCGGGGGSNVGPVIPPTRQVPTVNLSDNAEVQFSFLTGLGRRAPSNLIAVFSKIEASIAAYVTVHTYTPTADLLVGGWGTAPLFSQLSEKVPDDTNYVTYSGAGGSAFAVKVTGDTNPPTAVDHVVKVRAMNAAGSTITVELWQGSRRIGTWDHAITNTFSLYADYLSNNQISQITDYTDLNVRIIGTTAGDTVSYVDFEVRDPNKLTVPEDLKGTLDPLNIQLDGYTANTFSTTLTAPVFVSPNVYDSLNLTTSKIDQIVDGSRSTLYNKIFVLSDQDGDGNPLPIAIDLAVFKGRQATLPIYLDQAMLTYDAVNKIPVFDLVAFKDKNYDIDRSAILSHLTDYVAFDITNLTGTKPQMNTGVDATYVLYTGDSIALSGAPRPLTSADKTPNFEILDPTFLIDGLIRTPQDLGGGPTGPGSYTILEPDPRDLGGADGLVIPAVQGYWRAYTDAFSNFTDFLMVAFPNSRGTATQDLVAIKRNANSLITSMYVGTITYSGTTATIALNPVSSLSSGFIASKGRSGAALTGTARNFTKTNGQVVDGDFTLTSPPAGFPATGVFVVYRK